MLLATTLLVPTGARVRPGTLGKETFAGVRPPDAIQSGKYFRK